MNYSAQAGVYVIQNKHSGKRYIGSSQKISVRFNQHKQELQHNRHGNEHLQNAWNKYGVNAFVFDVLLVCDVKNTRLYEQIYINCFNPEYNKTSSAYSGIASGSTQTKEHKLKNSKAIKRLWLTEEHREKTVSAHRAAIDDEYRQQKSNTTKLLWQRPEYRERAIAARKGKRFAAGFKCSPEQVANRQRAARISNMKRNYGDSWKEEYIRRYPEHAGDVNG